MSPDKSADNPEESGKRGGPRTSYSKIAIVGTAIGAILGIIGVFIGALDLFSIWEGKTYFSGLYSEHPNLEVFGFLAIFILSVALTLIPKFKSRKLFSTKLAWEAIILIVAGNVLVLFTQNKFLPLDDLLIVGGALIALLLGADLLRRPSGPLAASEYFFWLSLISLFLAAALKTSFDSSAVDSSWDSFPFLEICLISFPAAMIFGIEVRTMVFRLARSHKRVLIFAVSLGIFGTGIAVLSSLVSKYSPQLTSIGAIVFLAFGISYLVGVEAFKKSPKERLSKMNERDLSRYLYFNRAFRISALWLVAALAFGLTYSFLLIYENPSAQFWIRDAFIHSMAIGFIGSAIAAYSPILLPSVISGRAPYKGLTNIPLYIVTFATIWRIIADILGALSLSTNNLYAGYSGILLVIGLLWFVWMNHRLG